MSIKRTRIIRCAIGGIVLATLLLGALRSPRTNGTGVDAVTFSRASGFYDDPFDLELRFDGGKIYYTLDSSDPDENSIPYEGPIHITDASANENVYCMNEDLSLEYHRDIIKHAGQSVHYGYRLPQSKVDKITVVRAVGVDAAGNRSDVVTGVYFVGFQNKTGYDNFGIIAITTDPKNLFDPDYGIYVLGNAFAQKLVDGYYKKTSVLYEAWPANYIKRGREWEREATVACFDTDRRLLFSGNLGIRIQGKLARGMLPRSLNLFARKEYGKVDLPALELFGENWQLGSLNLHAGAHTMRDMLRDYLANTLTSHMNFDTRIYMPYQLFLDGEYWGVYWLTPRYEKEYFQSKYGVPGDEVIDVKVDEIEIGRAEDIGLFNEMTSFIADNDMSDPAMYTRACELVDMSSCVDYYAAEIYFGNSDWPHSNVALWRTRGNDGGAYGDGRWRWILFDVNLSMALKHSESDFIKRSMKHDPMLTSLLDSPDFTQALHARLAELAVNEFNPARVETFIRDYETFMVDAMENEYLRFYDGKKTADDFIQMCEDVVTFYRQRAAYMLENFGDELERK